MSHWENGFNQLKMGLAAIAWLALLCACGRRAEYLAPYDNNSPSQNVATQASTSPFDVSGRWQTTWTDSQNYTQHGEIDLTQSGTQLSGSIANDPNYTGEIQGTLDISGNTFQGTMVYTKKSTGCAATIDIAVWVNTGSDGTPDPSQGGRFAWTGSDGKCGIAASVSFTVAIAPLSSP